ncbi:MAG: Gfo/Idh/MocA family oxidoreductase [Candidatus Aenigmarchaeota archaeon]|nr:Gfo/Idh/MocA family oxidoreductase [Candidatus Aenigmarchaeota archaeon]
MRVAVFIPVRTGSSRLAKKALLKIKGKTLIEHLIDRVKAARSAELIVLNTTTLAEDDILEEIARKNDIECFRGSTEDILDRHYQAAKRFKVDFIVNADGDDILCDPAMIDAIVDVYNKTGDDFIMFKDVPLGATPFGIKFDALEKVWRTKKESNTETGWVRYFKETGLFKLNYIEAEPDLRQPEIRMTLDYEEDFQFVKAVFDGLYGQGRIFGLKEILSFLKDNPRIISINSGLDEKYYTNIKKHSLKLGVGMKFLIIGLGSMGKRRVRNLQHLKTGEIIGFEPQDMRRKEAEEKYGIKTFGSLDAALRENPDAIIISTPPDKHGVYALMAARSGKHFFVETSVVLENEIKNEIIEANKIAKEKDIVAMPSCTMRFNWRMKRIKDLVDEGAIGKVAAFNYHMGQWLPDWHPWEDIKTFYVGKRETGAGREMVPFETEWLQWIFGPVSRIECIKGKFSQLPVDIDDVYSILLSFDRGMVGTLLIDVVSRSPVRRIEVIGDKGSIFMDWDDDKVRLFDADAKKWSEFVEEEKHQQSGYWAKDDAYIEEMKHFINIIDNKEKQIYTMDDDIKNLQLLLDAEKSSDDLE